MLIQAREIPIDPSMVSLWVPGGDDHAKDLIRNNFGQCYGTHPNVPVLPNVINPSLGWYFDGTDNYVVCGNEGLELPTDGTISLWMNSSGAYLGLRFLIYRYFGGYGYAIFFNNNNSLLNIRFGTNASSNIPVGNLFDGKWHYIVMTRDSGTFLRLYVDTVIRHDGGDDASDASKDTDTLLGGRTAGDWFDGYIALPSIAKSAWSAQQVNNFYLATRGLFSPRG